MTDFLNRRFFLMSVALVLLLLTHPALALDVPKLEGRVNDYGHLLSPSTVSLLESVLKDLETSDSTQIAVLTIPSLQGDSLERFSMEVVQSWKIGQKDFDNGALLLIAKGERKIRIEVGYGLEGVLTDLVAGRIIRDTITPQFRNGNFDQGVIDGVGAMIGAVKGEYQATDASRSGDDFGLGDMIVVSSLFLLILIGIIFRKNTVVAFIFRALGAFLLTMIAFMLVTLAGLPSDSQRSGGGFGGGGRRFGGGGGGFGGGGASGGW